MKDISTVILAAGKSSRFNHTKSKIFQDLGGLTIIDHVYRIAKKISGENIIFVCNEDNLKELKVRFPKANFSIQKKQLGTADAISSAKNLLKNTNVLILFGDVPLITIQSLKNLIKDFYKNKSIGSMIAFKTNKPHGYGRLKVSKNKIISVIEELNTTRKEKEINLCNSGVILCSSKLLFQNIHKIDNKNIKKEKYSPDIFSIFNKI